MQEMQNDKIQKFRDLSCFLNFVSQEIPKKNALVWEEKTVTYQDLHRNVCSLASSLRRYGIGKGDRVGCLMRNSSEMVYVWLGTLMNGSVFVPLNTALKGDFLAYQIQDSGPKLLFVDKDLLANVPKSMFTNKSVIVNSDHCDSSLTLSEFMSDGDSSYQGEKVLPSDPAEILYTSGTTDKPKGVVLPHYSFVNRAREVAKLVDLNEQDILFNCLPFFHTSGQVMTTLPALLSGLTTSQMEWFHTSRFWSFVSRSNATVTFLLMRMVNHLLNSEQSFVENRLRVILCGGVSKELQERFVKKFGVTLVEGYGMTETCGIAIFNTLKDNKIGSIGKPLPTVEVKLVDDRGNESSIGEILLRKKEKDTMLIQYLNHPNPFDQDGWFHTGDIARVDIGGYYYYVERKKDVIRSKGENIIPSQIESVAELYPGVLECAAAGVMCEETGDEEILIAVKNNADIEVHDFITYLRRELPSFMVPRFVLFVDQIPKTANQKVRRTEVRKLDIRKAIDTSKLKEPRV